MYAEGTVLAGKYRIERVLGEGGMGIVLAADHLHLGIKVALKVLHADRNDPDVIERFLREGRASAQLKSEHICRVMDLGVLDDGKPFIVMEMLVGNDLQTLVHNEGPMAAATACDCIMQACLGLAEAHAAGIVHRDLKPGNLFWTQRPDGSRLIKVLDFGVAKASKQVSFSLTQTMSLVGSPGYMSPEQLRSSRNVDVRSDIWALGVVLYELVSGRLPFMAESLTDLAMRIATDPVPPLVGVGPLEQVIGRCLEKNPEQRFSSVGELASALAPFVGRSGPETATAVRRVLRGGTGPIVHTAPMPSTPTTLRNASGVVTQGSGPLGWKLPALVAALAIAAGITVVVATMGGDDETRPSAAPVEQPASDEERTVVMDPVPTPTAPTPAAAAPAVPAPTPPVAPPTADPVAETPVEPPPDVVATEATAPAPARSTPTKAKSTTKPKAKPREGSKPKKTTIEEVSESRR